MGNRRGENKEIRLPNVDRTIYSTSMYLGRIHHNLGAAAAAVWPPTPRQFVIVVYRHISACSEDRVRFCGSIVVIYVHM